jgi:hypothetical protein
MELHQTIMRMKLIVKEDEIKVQSFLIRGYEENVKLYEFVQHQLDALDGQPLPETADMGDQNLDKIIRSVAEKFGKNYWYWQNTFLELYNYETLKDKQNCIARGIEYFLITLSNFKIVLQKLYAQKYDLLRWEDGKI